MKHLKLMMLSMLLLLAACSSAQVEPKLAKQDQVQLPALQAPAQEWDFIGTMQNFLSGSLSMQQTSK